MILSKARVAATLQLLGGHVEVLATSDDVMIVLDHGMYHVPLSDIDLTILIDTLTRVRDERTTITQEKP